MIVASLLLDIGFGPQQPEPHKIALVTYRQTKLIHFPAKLEWFYQAKFAMRKPQIVE
jgi:hypothetical protein